MDKHRLLVLLDLHKHGAGSKHLDHTLQMRTMCGTQLILTSSTHLNESIGKKLLHDAEGCLLVGLGASTRSGCQVAQGKLFVGHLVEQVQQEGSPFVALIGCCFSLFHCISFSSLSANCCMKSMPTAMARSSG